MDATPADDDGAEGTEQNILVSYEAAEDLADCLREAVTRDSAGTTASAASQ